VLSESKMGRLAAYGKATSLCENDRRGGQQPPGEERRAR